MNPEDIRAVPWGRASTLLQTEVEAQAISEAVPFASKAALYMERGPAGCASKPAFDLQQP